MAVSPPPFAAFASLLISPLFKAALFAPCTVTFCVSGVGWRLANDDAGTFAQPCASIRVKQCFSFQSIFTDSTFNYIFID